MSTLYSDNLIDITDEGITFRKYDWMFHYRPRLVPFSDIAQIETRRPSLWTGKWRLFGSGDFQTWFPLDWRRPSRDKIFLALLRNSPRRIFFSREKSIGFTVEDSTRVEDILKGKGLLGQNPSA